MTSENRKGRDYYPCDHCWNTRAIPCPSCMPPRQTRQMTISKLKQLSDRWGSAMRDVALGTLDKSALAAIDVEVIEGLIAVAAEMSDVVESLAEGPCTFGAYEPDCVYCNGIETKHDTDCIWARARKLCGL